MNEHVFTVRQDTDIHSLARLLTERQISGAPVLDDQGQLVGVVSLFDLALHQGQACDSQSAAYWQGTHHWPRGFRIAEEGDTQARVSDIMTPAVHCLDEDSHIRDACDLFLLGKLHRVLITRANQLVGIVTSSDLLRVLRDQLG